MVYRILASSYTEYIYTLNFEPASGSLDLVHKTHTGQHPSWITPYPHDKSLIFAGLEHQEGKIVALKFVNGKGVPAKTITSGGSDPCSLLATKDELFVANYSGGGVALLPISPDLPYLLTTSPEMVVMSGRGPNKRQNTSHPHQVALIEEYQELLVPDLGADKVWRLKRDSEGLWKQSAYIEYEAGSGPRHVVYYDGHLYTICELSNRIFKHRLPPLPSEPEYIASSPTMSSPPSHANDMFAAEILLPNPNTAFPKPYLYASNRDDPSPEGDTIAVFSVGKPGELQLVNEVRTGLRHVRGMEFGGPDGRWLIVGGVHAGGVKVFERVDDGKDLRVVAVNEEVDSPAGFLWV
ncbi:hypothetical protein AX15_006629 [Amanita polypyramis BW_CC]|nr:hypothetical protein AX15_006629 [Amanita polypyramis BW_CC]